MGILTHSAYKTAYTVSTICELSMDSRCSEGRCESPTGYFQNPRIFNRCGDFCFVTLAGRVNDLFTVDKRMAIDERCN